MTDGQIPHALDIALGIAEIDDHVFADALTGLAPRLTGNQLLRALKACSGLIFEDALAHALTALGRHLPADQRPAIIARALDTAAAISDDSARARALADLLPLLDAEQVARILGITTALRDSQARARTMIAVFPRLTAEQLVGSFDAVTAISDDRARATALTAFTRCLPADQQPAIIARAYDAVTAISDDYARATALTALAPCLPADQQPAIIAQAFEITIALSVGNPRQWALQRLAPYMTVGQLARTLDIIAVSPRRVRTEALTAVAPYLASGHLARALSMAAVLGPRPLIAVVARAETFIDEDSSIFISLIRDAIQHQGRAECLSLIAHAASSIKKVAGAWGIKECVDAVSESILWWQ